MITRNFKNMLAMVAGSYGIGYGITPSIDVNGMPRYMSPNMSNYNFPGGRTQGVTLTANAAGISVGRGGTAPTEQDWKLEDPITAGISLVLTTADVYADEYGSPYLKYSMTITNTSGAELTIRELGYKQACVCAEKPGWTGTGNVVFLLDRTVLDEPMVLAAGDAGVIDYVISTLHVPHASIDGVELVSFSWGTDAQISALIEAAHAGKLDLQNDAGWAVGDMRIIHVDAFTGGGNTVHAAQDVAVVISSFKEYENCGNIVQIDFYDGLAIAQRMHSSNSNVDSFNASEMAVTTLPAMQAALPEWMRDALLPFSIRVSEGNNSMQIKTVPGNTISFRSEVEILGTFANSMEGEGSQVDFYKMYRIKRRGNTGGTNAYWTRSPAKNAAQYVYISNNGTGAVTNAASVASIAPFVCL